jgi:hypothetical protein
MRRPWRRPGGTPGDSRWPARQREQLTAGERAVGQQLWVFTRTALAILGIAQGNVRGERSIHPAATAVLSAQRFEWTRRLGTWALLYANGARLAPRNRNAGLTRSRKSANCSPCLPTAPRPANSPCGRSSSTTRAAKAGMRRGNRGMLPGVRAHALPAPMERSGRTCCARLPPMAHDIAARNAPDALRDVGDRCLLMPAPLSRAGRAPARGRELFPQLGCGASPSVAESAREANAALIRPSWQGPLGRGPGARIPFRRKDCRRAMRGHVQHAHSSL